MLLLTLKAGANRYAIDVTRVIELVPNVELRRIPHAPPFLAGLLSYRGKVIPVLDLGLLLDSAACRDYLSTRIILVNDGPRDHNSGKDVTARPSESHPGSASDSSILGLIGEGVSDLTSVQQEQIMSAPVQLARAPFLDGIVQTEEGIVQLIAVERIREASLRGYVLDQGATECLDRSKAEAIAPVLEDLQTDD